MTLARCLLVALGFVACSREARFPERPPLPSGAGAVTPVPLARLAEKGAIDCGEAGSVQSNDRVYQCASDALRGHRPFFCRYPARPDSRSGEALIGTSDGVVFEARQWGADRYVRDGVVLVAGSPRQPLCLRPGMKPPVVLSSSPVPLRQERAGMMFVSVGATIAADGALSAIHFEKPVMPDVRRACEAVVTSAKFAPARFFGVAVPVNLHLDIRVEHDKAEIEQLTF